MYQATGEVLDIYTSTDAPDGVVYKVCGTRRASLCPACAEVAATVVTQLVTQRPVNDAPASGEGVADLG